MVFHAHSTPIADKRDWQKLDEHSLNVAELAARFGRPLGIARAATLAGLLHDLGKYNPDFQALLTGSKERVDHSTAGAAIICQRTTGDNRRIGELIAYAIAGHHAGLPDMNGTALSTLAERLQRFSPDSIDPAWEQELSLDTTDLVPAFQWEKVDRARAAFQFALLGRMIFSCLVDADFKDTERYYDGIEHRSRDRDWPELAAILPGLIDRYEAHMARFGEPVGELNQLRASILAHVRGRATEPPGLYTLTVPTGGGKTLASLGFALDHAQAHGHSRIICAIPFTSVIDQTAAIFREVLGDDAVLEHHSAIDEEKAASGRDKLKLAMEDWAAPIVVTTNVQLFESLFAARTSSARKLHNIANSIIILDEAQTLPRPLLLPVVRTLDALARDYGCTIVLCTATQPALDRANFPEGLPLAGKELAPDPEHLAQRLRRVTLRHAGPMSDDAIIAELADSPQGLVIVNSRKHALQLYRASEAAGLSGLVHLTTRQYATHRRLILADVRQRLEQGAPCRLIATSLVEAGVDLDFPRAWRAEAGLDQIAQAAGRVNREGKRPIEQSLVTIFEAPDNPAPPEIKGLTGDMRRMMDHYDDLFAPAAMAAFFREVYWRHGAGLDRGRVDGEPILSKFTVDRSGTNFSYRSAAENFRMIESGMLPVIIRGDETAEQAIEQLEIEKVPSGALARKLQTYIVQVPPRARDQLIDAGKVAFAGQQLRGEQFAVLLDKKLYDKTVGLLWEDADYLSSEQWMI